MNDENVGSQKNVNTTLSTKDLFGLMSKPLQVAISIALTITGVSMFSCFTVIARFEKLVETLGNITLDIDIALIVLLFFILIFAITTFFIAITSIMALLRLKLINKNIISNAEKVIEELTNNIIRLDFTAKQLTLSKYILDEEQITTLESGIHKNERIIVMTSKFHLDTGKLLDIILTNIKKGVIYQYVIPGEKKREKKGGKPPKILGTYHSDFILTRNNWWNTFKEDLFRNEPYDIITMYHPEYQKLKEDAINIGVFSKEIEERAQNYFLSHVQEFLVNKDYSLVTIIMYQKGAATDHNYDIIMKLPTVTDDNYYAFKIPDEEKAEKKDLSEIIEAFCREEPINIKLN